MNLLEKDIRFVQRERFIGFMFLKIANFCSNIKLYRIGLFFNQLGLKKLEETHEFTKFISDELRKAANTSLLLKEISFETAQQVYHLCDEMNESLKIIESITFL